MSTQNKKPEIIVFAGPNGSGKSTITKLCDVMHIYDNSTIPFRIFKKRKEEYFFWENEEWSEEKIHNLTDVE